MAGSTDVMEGFLCPLCMKDFGTVTQLQDHFEVAHTSEDKAVFQHLKGFFDKAKKRILGDKDLPGFASSFSGQREDDASYISASAVSSYDPSWWEPQELGVTRNHIEIFKAQRDSRVDHFIVETNKLLIRLDKLIVDDAPMEPSKRKAFEKSVVPWIPDNEVPACLSCMQTFSLLRRRHHCRVCGGIICHNCSVFLTFSYAQKLVNPAFSFQGEGFLKRTNSNSSLNSLIGSDGERHMRICDICRKLLERRDKMTEQRNSKPNIVLLYEKMKSCIDDAQELISRYMPMVESLSNGESIHSYRQAQILRAKLSKTYEIIDQLSKKILIHNLDADPQPNPKQLYLQKSIRIYASNFMQENLMGLQALPTEEEYTKMQESRKEKIQQKIAVERLAAMEAQEKERRNEEPEKPGKSPTDSVKQLGHRRSDSSDSVGKGWKPTEVIPKVDKADDPMLQQIEIIRGYVRQARQAQKWDEVEMLEQNLKEIQQEYIRQQGQNFKS